LEIIVKELSDGSKAFGLFNRNSEARVVVADWKTLGFSGLQRLRDVWRHKDIGTYEGSFSAKVPPHGIVLLSAQPCSKKP
jgi:alpha-galactosidase